jgi:hypothetical protein
MLEASTTNQSTSASKTALRGTVTEEFLKKMTQRDFTRTRELLLDSLMKWLREEKLLTESQIKRIQIEKAIKEKELYHF